MRKKNYNEKILRRKQRDQNMIKSKVNTKNWYLAITVQNVFDVSACRTGVIFCVFQANKGKIEATAKRESRARGGARKN